MTDLTIFDGITAIQKSNPVRLYKGDTLSIRSTTAHSVDIYSNPIQPYSASNDNLVQTETTDVDLVSPSEAILVLDATIVTGSLDIIIVRNTQDD